MKTEQTLVSEIAERQAQLSRIRTTERKAAASKMVGKCFKFRNSRGDKRKWWLYVRIIRIDKCGGLRLLKFEDSGIQMRVDPSDYRYWADFEDYTEISSREFDSAWKKFVRKLSDLNKGDWKDSLTKRPEGK